MNDLQTLLQSFGPPERTLRRQDYDNAIGVRAGYVVMDAFCDRVAEIAREQFNNISVGETCEFQGALAEVGGKWIETRFKYDAAYFIRIQYHQPAYL
jgi:hypothetical protein